MIKFQQLILIKLPKQLNIVVFYLKENQNHNQFFEPIFRLQVIHNGRRLFNSVNPPFFSEIIWEQWKPFLSLVIFLLHIGQSPKSLLPNSFFHTSILNLGDIFSFLYLSICSGIKLSLNIYFKNLPMLLPLKAPK